MFFFFYIIAGKEIFALIGTIANAAAICAGSFLGSKLKQGIGAHYKAILMDAMGLAATVLGIRSAVLAMPDSQLPVLFIVSLAAGGLIGTRLQLADAFERLVSKFPGQSDLAQGLSTAILLFCAGTLSILGPMQSALQGDHTYLFTNAILDGITSIVLSSTFGFGIAAAAGVLFCWQGGIYLLARFIEPWITAPLLTELSIVGGILILSSGLNILNLKKFETLNLLPALAVPAIVVPIATQLGLI